MAQPSSPGSWLAQGEQTVGGGATTKRFHHVAKRITVLCTNRRLGRPRQVSYDNEQSFEGWNIRGLSGDNAGLPWLGKRVVILGHGPFAVEQARTALEHHSARVMLLVRRHGLVCPEVLGECLIAV